MEIKPIEKTPPVDPKTCRLCCAEKHGLVDLFSNVMYYGENKEVKFDKLDTIISQLTKLQVAADDRLPQEVCKQCVNTLFGAKNFIEKCIKTDQILRELNSNECLEGKLINNKTEVKDERKLYLHETVDIKDNIVRLDDLHFPFCPSNDVNDIDTSNIIKVEPFQKTVENEMSDCNSLVDSNDFDLTENMIMSLPDIDVEHKPQVETEIKTKLKSKIKVKKKKKRFSKLRHSNEQSTPTGNETVASDIQLLNVNQEKEQNNIHVTIKRKRNESKQSLEKQTFVCVTCGATLSSKQNLKVHQATHLDDRPFSCDQCDLKFKLKSHLNGHKRNVHNGEKNHFCSECGKGFFSIAQFKFHMMTHTKEYPHICVHCGKRFAQSGNLKDHIKTHTGVRDVKCPYCPYITTSSNCLNSHIKGIHKNNKPMQCSECGLRFLYPSGLKRHLTIHTGEKEFQCSHCEKRFRTAEAYKEHIRIHTKEKPYKCRYCEKQCRTYNHRLVHERVHTGNRPYVCQVCKKGFTTNGNLKTHMKTHDKTFE